MTVQRQYTLPNCSLIVEGLGSGDGTDPTAPLTVVLNAECKFPGITDTLVGGREFLEALVKTVSAYAQSVLSDVTYPVLEGITESEPVVLKPGENQRHQLIANMVDNHDEAVCKTLTLSTVQLFDLMEAVDQLLTDAQTLPDITLKLSPLHRRYAHSAEPVTKRLVPAATGLSALAAAASLLFVLPVPEIEPEPIREEQETSTLVEEDAASAPPDAETTIPSSQSGTTGTVDELTPSANAASAATALTRLSTAPQITDPDEIAALEEELADTLEEALPSSIAFEESLTYRVAVSEAGDLLGYKYENDAALLNVDNTPLPELTFIPVASEQTEAEPVVQFRVTFDPDGKVVVESLAVGEETDN